MKTTLLTLMIAMFSGLLTAQKSNLIFFAENGERFTVVMNGLRYNEVPATNVKLSDLTAPSVYKVKVLFEDVTLGEVTKTINLEPFVEYTFNVRPKKETALGKGINKASNQIAKDFGGQDSSKIKKAGEEKVEYVIRFVSETPLTMPMAQQPVMQSPPPAVVYAPAPTTTVVAPGTVTQTTRTTTTTSQPTGAVMGTGMNVSVNDPDLGVNFNMNVGIPVGTVVTTGGTVQQTTTTTYSSGGSAPAPVVVQQAQRSHYMMPGYTGAIGCPWPMDQSAFSGALGTINGQSFEDNKLQIAKQVFTSNCMTTAQVSQIMALFSFEDSKLDFAKFAYGRTYDLSNYFMVNNAFTFSSSVDELNDFIQSQPRR
jgi:hypothetical protein